MLDLGRQVQGTGTAAALVDVGEGPVGDDDVSQGVRGRSDLPHPVVVGTVRQEQFDLAGGVAAVGDGRHHPDQTVSLQLDGRPLCAQYVRLDGARQSDALRGLTGLDVVGCPEPHHRRPGEVHDQERGRSSVQAAPEHPGDDIQ
ncbi:hypothetical protein ACFYNM_13090 [Streptomyces spororaveus]|uniref:hypothetical protein n=1 Tax=Streptomyces spororaveus TaxID=284039 RepID=UPI0036A95DF5